MPPAGSPARCRRREILASSLRAGDAAARPLPAARQARAGPAARAPAVARLRDVTFYQARRPIAALLLLPQLRGKSVHQRLPQGGDHTGVLRSLRRTFVANSKRNNNTERARPTQGQ